MLLKPNGAFMRRVVVTGCGLVTPFGVGLQANLDGLKEAKSAIVKIPENFCDTSDLPVKIAGLVPSMDSENGFNPEKFINPKDISKMDLFCQYAVSAATEAVEDSGIGEISIDDSYRAGVMVGSGIGGLISIEHNVIELNARGPRRISPFFIPRSLINLPSGWISIKYGYKGPNHAVATACATGAHAIGDAAELIARGKADIMVAGGTEAPVCRTGIAGFSAMRALSSKYNDTPSKASRPWDTDRDGFVMAEGAGIVVLEEYERAKKRGAKIYAELIGYGLSGDAYHISSPSIDGDGGYRAMRMALDQAQITYRDLDYINAHGTSTPAGDVIELHAIRRLLEENLESCPVSSTKSSIGHLLGAAGGVEAVYSLLALQHQFIPATINLDNPSAEAKGFDLVPNTPRQSKLNIVLSNSFGFGGTNASLIFKKI